MPIAALPEDTVRTIGSTQVLTDSTSVVKELVDNALDARASAIFVEISANALDVIQVKDNGYGIAPADRALVCKRYCTSKITSFDDIASIGGLSLGFRGEALASAAEMSGSLIVTMRIEGESTGTSLKIGRQGQVDSEERSSHPVGTTVRVVDYLKNIPVRRQTAIRATAKALSTTRRTLQAYALARPAVRFSLRVLKAKNEKGNWTYAPKAGASVIDAAAKVVGKKVVDQCHWKVWRSTEKNISVEAPEPNSNPQETFIVESVLAIPGCDVSYITGAGQYLSIDSRPVTCARGTLKQIVSLYKSYLRSACGLDSGDKIIDPFFCMNIVCPAGSYDANIEPAKDDVLFTDARLVLQMIEAFLKSVYGELQATAKALPTSRSAVAKSHCFDILLARKQQPTEPPSPPPERQPRLAKSRDLREDTAVSRASPDHDTRDDGTSDPVLGTNDSDRRGANAPSAELSGKASLMNPSTSSRKNAWKPNMYAADEDDEMGLFVAQDRHGKVSQLVDPEEEAGLRDIQVSNPWSIAKVNAPIRTLNKSTDNRQLLTPARQRDDVESAWTASPATIMGDAQPISQMLLTPQQSHRDFSDTGAPSSSPERFPYPLAARNSRSGDHASRSQRASNRERYGGGALDTWVQKSINGYTDAPCSVADDDEGANIDPETGSTRRRDFVSARLLPTGTPFGEIPSAPARPRKSSPQKQAGNGINKPFTSPLTDDRVWFEVGLKHKTKPPRPDHSISTQSTLSPDNGLHFSSEDINSTTSLSHKRSIHPDLALTLDYENRKALATQQHKASLIQQKRQQPQVEATLMDTRSTSNSPHKNRYNKAIAALHQDDEASARNAVSPRPASVFEAGDPRQYWMRVQEREQAADATPGVSPSRAPAAKRRKTAMLPLETMREEWNVRDLVLPIQGIKVREIADDVKRIWECDAYISSRKPNGGLLAAKTIDTVRAWEDQIRLLIRTNYKSDDPALGVQGAPAQLRVELWPVMQEHLAAYPVGDGGEEVVESV